MYRRGFHSKLYKYKSAIRETPTLKRDRNIWMQKINYIHNNSVTGKWMLAKGFIEYEHSSASFYEMQLLIHFRLLHYLDL